MIDHIFSPAPQHGIVVTAREQAEHELREEQFRALVEADKVRLRRRWWHRIPVRFTISISIHWKQFK